MKPPIPVGWELSTSTFHPFLSAKEAVPEDESGEGLPGWALGASMAFALVAAVALFVGIPHLISVYFLGPSMKSPLFHLLDGAVKGAVFVLYIALIGRLPDIRRVFQYHGAEHKAVHAYEQGVELTPEQAGSMSRIHPRCGTAFLMVVILAGILVFAAVLPLLAPPEGRVVSLLWAVGVKTALLVPVAGISYEMIRLGSGEHVLSRAVFRPFLVPGLLLQRLTTGEPDAEQLDVAIHALSLAVQRGEGAHAG